MGVQRQLRQFAHGAHAGHPVDGGKLHADILAVRHFFFLQSGINSANSGLTTWVSAIYYDAERSARDRNRLGNSTTAPCASSGRHRLRKLAT